MEMAFVAFGIRVIIFSVERLVRLLPGEVRRGGNVDDVDLSSKLA